MRRYRILDRARLYQVLWRAAPRRHRRPAPHRWWGARQMDQMTDILGWREAVAILKPIVGRGGK